MSAQADGGRRMIDRMLFGTQGQIEAVESRSLGASGLVVAGELGAAA